MLESQQALEGVRVVEFSQGMAGPWIGRMMAWSGAEVIRVESHRVPGVVRLYAPCLLSFAHDVVRLAQLRAQDMTLASLVRWDSVLLVQRFRSPAADAWFTHFPLLGNEVQYALAMPLLAWYAHDAG